MVIHPPKISAADGRAALGVVRAFAAEGAAAAVVRATAVVETAAAGKGGVTPVRDEAI